MEEEISLNDIFFAIRKQWRKILTATYIRRADCFFDFYFFDPEKVYLFN